MKRFVIIQRLCVTGLILTLSSFAPAFPSVTKLADTTVDSQALTINSYGQAINGLSFQQNPVITFNGWQYVAYYHGNSTASGVDGYVCVARRKLDGNGFDIRSDGTVIQSMLSLAWQVSEWSVIELSDYSFTSNDAHNVVTMGICPNDGTIHLSYDHHGQTLHYRISDTEIATDPESVTWDAAIFGATESELISGETISDVTYPRFWQTPDGDLQFGYRTGGSGSGDWYIVDYSATTGLWSNNREIIDRSGTYSDSVFTNSTSRNPYINTVGYGPDGRFHVSWTWRESSSDCNHDILYAYSDDNGITWYNTNGVQIADTSNSEVITLDSSGITIITLDTNRGMMNQQAQAIDADGRVHTLMFYCDSERTSDTFGTINQRRYYHHYRDTDGTWYQNELQFDTNDTSSWVGSRPKLYLRDNGDAFAIYQAWQEGDVTLSDTDIYIRYGDLVIQAATAENNWSDWQIIHVETGPFVSEALADPYRFQAGKLSVMMQQSPESLYDWTALRILDFQLND